MDFGDIRPHEDSKNLGFEELVCQFARLQEPSGAARFFRKGTGGDGGIECYWELEDGTEIGWQAKYFLKTLENSQFQQIASSFQTALEKHPKLSTFYISIPRNLSDSRAKKKGKSVTTERDRWSIEKAKLEKYAQERGRTIEIIEWFKTDLLTLLQTDTPQHRGKAIYWFNKEILSFEKFERVFEKNKTALGERYTPGDHVELRISQTLETTFLYDSFLEDFQKRITIVVEALERPRLDAHEIETSQVDNFRTDLITLYDHSAIDPAEAVRETSSLTFGQLENALQEVIYEPSLEDSKKHSDLRIRLHTKLSSIQEFRTFVHSKYFQTAVQGRLLLTGAPGAGKSHLICDFCERRIEASKPILFILGQHYGGGNPLDFLKRECDADQLNDSDFLGALSAVAEAYRQPFPIIIDALNEGPHSSEWKNHLIALNTELGNFPHLRLIVSCRSTYRRFIIPEDVRSALNWPTIEHPGFSGTEQEAIEQYFGNRNIIPPILPFYPPQFSNPLLLKTFAQLLEAQGLTIVPDGLMGLSKLFDSIMKQLETKIANHKEVFAEENTCHAALSEFSKHLLAQNLFGIPVSEARQTINSCDPNPTHGEPLFNLLINEGTLCNDYSPDGTLVTRFAYERFTDQFVAEMVIREAKDSSSVDRPFSESLHQILSNCPAEPWQMIGILTIISITLAEVDDLELVDLIPAQSKFSQIVGEDVFLDDLLWRKGEKVTPRTVTIFESHRTDESFQSDFFDHLICLSTRLDHPLNGLYLHQLLDGMTMPDRDQEWSIHLAVDGNILDESTTSNIWKLIRWASHMDIRTCEGSTAELAATTLSWFLSAPNRIVRDHATKALARLFCAHPSIISPTLENFWEINDPYILERVVLAAYGACCRIEDGPALKRCAEFLVLKCFSEGTPLLNIVLRDAAKGIVLIAKRDGLCDVDESVISPPFASSALLVIPNKAEIEALEGDNFSSSVESSLMGHPGDFGNYSMSSVTKWSTTPIQFGAPRSVEEIQNSAIRKLSKTNREIYTDFLDAKKGEEEARRSPSWWLKQKRASADEGPLLSEKEDAAAKFDEDAIKLFVEAEAPEEYKALGHYVTSAPSKRSKPEFSKQAAQLWVCKRVHDLGWSEDKFGAYETNFAGYSSRSEPALERVGKKYQWIAYHEFLAHLSDQYCFINPGYSDVVWDLYFGPWQVHQRNLDPTNFESFESASLDENAFPFLETKIRTNKISSLGEWFSGSRIFDRVEDWVTCTAGGQEWVCLAGFQKVSGTLKPGRSEEIRLDEWFRVHSCIVPNQDHAEMASFIDGEWLGDPHVFEQPNNSHDGFLCEFPWHPFYHERPQEDWFSTSTTRWSEKGLPDADLPILEYNWEFGSSDRSLTGYVSYFLPAPKLINTMELSHCKESPNLWRDKNGEVKFISMNKKDSSSSVAWIERVLFSDYLKQVQSTLVLTIGGEKNIYQGQRRPSYKRKNLNALCSLNEEGVELKEWTDEEGDLEI